jgi:predicted nucleotidyltransferase
MSTRLFPDEAALASVCRRHHVRRLALFGSTLKGSNRSDSDVGLPLLLCLLPRD